METNRIPACPTNLGETFEFFQYIGGGNYEAALTKTAAHDVEVIDLKQLDAWTEEGWGGTTKQE